MEVSRTKSVCTAARPEDGRELQSLLTEFGIKYDSLVKSLGTGLGAGPGEM